MTVFCRSTMHHNTIDDGNVYLGSLYFSMVIILFNGFTEVPMLVAKLPVLYKHRDLHFYPSWAYTLPSWLLSIPTSIIESATWVAVTYYTIGYDPQFSRYILVKKRIGQGFGFLKKLTVNSFNLQVSSAVPAVFPSASDVLESFSCDGFFRPTYDSCQYVWVLCNAGGHDSWRIYNFQRSSYSFLESLNFLLYHMNIHSLV